MSSKSSLQDIGTLRFWQQKAWSGLGGVNQDQSVTLAGYDLFTELAGKISLAGCLHLYFKKKLPSPEVERLLSAIITATIYPDIRIWPNRAVAFCAANNTGYAAGVCSGLMGIEGLMFGGNCVAACFKFLTDLEQASNDGKSIENQISRLKSGKIKIPGFGRPLVNGDERLRPILQVAKECRLSDGKWLTLGRKVETLLEKNYGITMNAAGLMACLLADMDFSYSEILAFGTFAPVISFFGILNEHSDSGASPIFPLAIADIEYRGPFPEDFSKGNRLK